MPPLITCFYCYNRRQQKQKMQIKKFLTTELGKGWKTILWSVSEKDPGATGGLKYPSSIGISCAVVITQEIN